MQTAKNTITKITPGFKKEIIKIIDERIREANVTKEDFSELKAILRDLGIKTGELAESQKKSEERLTRVEIALDELAQAQKRTEQRVEELAQAQKRTEQRVEELAQAQKRTEQRVEELAQAQKRTEQRVEELAQAQKKTEEALTTLAKEHGITRKLVGDLSHTVGYRLEDEAFKALPRLFAENYGIRVKGRLKRTFLKDKKGRDIEVNIFGEGIKGNNTVTIIGESKSQISKNEVDRFINKRLNLFKGIYEDIFPVIVTYMISEPDAEEYAKNKGIALFYSYDF